MRAAIAEIGGPQVGVIDGPKGDSQIASSIVERGDRKLWISTIRKGDSPVYGGRPRYETKIFDVRRPDRVSSDPDGSVHIHAGLPPVMPRRGRRHSYLDFLGLRETIHPALIPHREVEQRTRPAALRRHEKTLAIARRALGDRVSA